MWMLHVKWMEMY